jgi:NADH-quinone oxidoreductase subunit J
MEMAVFVLFALLALGSAVVVITHKNPVYSTMSLVLTLFSLAVLFVLLGAPFIATLQVLIYTGAILVLFLFVIMLLNIGRQEVGSDDARSLQRWAALAGGAIFLGMVGMTAWRAYGGRELGPLSERFVSLSVLADMLFDRYLLAFEIVGLLLLVAVIAATALARKPPQEPSDSELEAPRLGAEPTGAPSSDDTDTVETAEITAGGHP